MKTGTYYIGKSRQFGKSQQMIEALAREYEEELRAVALRITGLELRIEKLEMELRCRLSPKKIEDETPGAN